MKTARHPAIATRIKTLTVADPNQYRPPVILVGEKITGIITAPDRPKIIVVQSLPARLAA